MRKQVIGWAAGVFLLLSLFPQQTALAQTVTAVPKLDFDRYIGAWYEVARYPVKAEKHCLSNVAVLYALGDRSRRFQVVTSCMAKNNNPDARNSVGKVSKAGDGKLTFGYLWPFTSKRWVLAIGPAYEWALLGTPNRKSLWVLSRTNSLTPEVLADIQGKAAAQGFRTAKLVMVPQNH